MEPISNIKRQYQVETYRTRIKISEEDPMRTSNSTEVERIARAIFGEFEPQQEHFLLLALNTKNQIIGFKMLFTGGAATSTVDPKLVFYAVLVLNGTSFICVHNHPSGNSAPSSEDRALTQRLAEGGKILNFRMLDHLILGDREVFSFADAGLMQ